MCIKIKNVVKFLFNILSETTSTQIFNFLNDVNLYSILEP